MAMMRLRSLLLPLLLALLLPLLASSAKRTGRVVGGWNPIKDLNDSHVKEIAEFAVTEYNKQSKAALKLKSIVKGETQVVEGLNYRLVVAVTNGAADERYQAVVWEKIWVHFRNLTSFKPVV